MSACQSCVALASLTLILAIGDRAAAAGRFNLPTSLPQCLGVGFGPGYHAPMLLGPAMRAGTESQQVRRLPAAPRSGPSYGFGAPAVRPASATPLYGLPHAARPPFAAPTLAPPAVGYSPAY
ncbi:MAG: hypothetical protein AAFV43_08695 [Planctomycetota bacterium]